MGEVLTLLVVNSANVAKVPGATRALKRDAQRTLPPPPLLHQLYSPDFSRLDIRIVAASSN